MKFEIIYPKDVKRLREGGAVLVDLRSGDQYHQGHFPGAKNLPEPSGRECMERFNKKNNYILYCERGGRSMELARDLADAGFRVGTVVGGWIRLRQYV